MDSGTALYILRKDLDRITHPRVLNVWWIELARDKKYWPFLNETSQKTLLELVKKKENELSKTSKIKITMKQIVSNTKLKMSTALRMAKEGYFEFVTDAKIGINIVRYRTSSGSWKEKQIEII